MSRDNYALSRDRAQQYFLQFDQEAFIKAWGLQADETSVFVTFLGGNYRICRKTGSISLPDGSPADYSETLSIFDLLCHQSPVKFCTGRHAPVNSLPGSPKAGGVPTDFHSRTAAFFDEHFPAFEEACLALGGVPVSLGDTAFRFTVFEDLTVILKFYHADEEFPPAMTLLWEENTLQYVYYETVFYIAGCLLGQIWEKMRGTEHGS